MHKLLLLALVASHALTQTVSPGVSEAQDDAELQSEVEDHPSSVKLLGSSIAAENDRIAGELAKYVKVQPKWIEDNKFDVQAITNLFPASAESYVEYDFGKFRAQDLAEDFVITGIKTTRWCFLKFSGSIQKKFFFECLQRKLNNEIFLRVVNEDCPYPPVKDVQPPIQQSCFMHYRLSQEAVSSIVDAVGEGNADSIIDCVITAMVNKPNPDVETMCSKEAFVAGWEALSGKRWEQIEAENTRVSGDGLNNKYDGGVVETKIEKGKIDGKVVLAQVNRSPAKNSGVSHVKVAKDVNNAKPASDAPARQHAHKK